MIKDVWKKPRNKPIFEIYKISNPDSLGVNLHESCSLLFVYPRTSIHTLNEFYKSLCSLAMFWYFRKSKFRKPQKMRIWKVASYFNIFVNPVRSRAMKVISLTNIDQNLQCNRTWHSAYNFCLRKKTAVYSCSVFCS